MAEDEIASATAVQADSRTLIGPRRYEGEGSQLSRCAAIKMSKPYFWSLLLFYFILFYFILFYFILFYFFVCFFRSFAAFGNRPEDFGTRWSERRPFFFLDTNTNTFIPILHRSTGPRSW